MDQVLAMPTRNDFEASFADFTARARTQGFAFWRGLLVGFLAGFPLGHIAVFGEGLFGLV
ncbi:MAG: hypothetical protein JWR08_897 [Enterovirga sp.]|jgi:hypothetical protein|nr:hypothetical protein [Enterovirga sp.]